MREVHCHKLIRATAIEMAGELYDDFMKDNKQYDQWKAACPELTPVKMEIMFIELMWPKLIESARHTLAKMLETNINEELKETIADALIKDNTLARGRAHG